MGNKKLKSGLFSEQRNKYRPWWVSVLCVLVLTSANIFLLIKLLHCSTASSLVATQSLSLNDPSVTPTTKPAVLVSTNLRNLSPERNLSATQEQELQLRLTLGRWDASRKYHIHEFAWIAPEFGESVKQHGLCLATQSSLDRLAWLPLVATQWGGAISVAVYVHHGQLPLLQRLLRFIQQCNPDAFQRVAVHVMISREKQPTPHVVTESDLQRALDGATCEAPGATTILLQKLFAKGFSKRKPAPPYPQNHLRNVARKSCPAEHVFLLDIDIVPSPSLAPQLATFLKSPAAVSCVKCAYVIPTFELDETIPIVPSNKSGLLALEAQNRARPFHQEVFLHNQFATNFSQWRLSGDSTVLQISHYVTNFEFFYEPFYVAKDDVPPHDERFVGYGFTRNTQVYEMHLAGWTFAVLSPVFTWQRGFQTRAQRPTWRENQNAANRRLFQQVKKELYIKYKKDVTASAKFKKKPTSASLTAH